MVKKIMFFLLIISLDAHAILWRDGQEIDLGIWPGGHYSVANGINNTGQIVGTGTISGDNLDHALMWTVAADNGTVNTTPSASIKAASPTSIRIGGSLSVKVSFTDPDNGPWSYKLDWGDGITMNGNTSTSGTITTIKHVYNKTGTFKVRLAVTDSQGATGNSNIITVKVR